MKVILCRLGESTVPYYIQKRWFELNGQFDMFPVYYRSKKLTKEERKKYPNTGYYKDRLDYIHYYKVRNPDDNNCRYYYCNNKELKTVQSIECLFRFTEGDLNDKEYKKLFDQYYSIQHRGLEINDSNRTNPELVKLVEEYCENCSGTDDSWYGCYPMKVVEIPDNIEWYVDQPEGCNEIIREKHRIWGMNGLLKGK